MTVRLSETKQVRDVFVDGHYVGQIFTVWPGSERESHWFEQSMGEVDNTLEIAGFAKPFETVAECAKAVEEFYSE